jgi:DNA-binding PadR family transcriptional regulator
VLLDSLKYATMTEFASKPIERMPRMITLIIVSPPCVSEQMHSNDFLPLKPIDFIILLALLEEERHGYGLALEIEQRSGGTTRIEPGNLYRNIKRLMSDGLLAEAERRAAPDLEDERRRYYRITGSGKRVARAEMERLRQLLASPAARRLRRMEPA